MKKVCKKCNEEKELEEFRRQRKICKKCESIDALNYYRKNKDKVSKYAKEYHKKSERYKQTKKNGEKKIKSI